MLLVTGLLIFLFGLHVSAEALKKNQVCFDTVYESYGYMIFAGDDAESYYYSACQYPPKVLSIYAAAKVYCTPDEINAGIEFLGHYCEEYGPDLELLPLDSFAANLSDAAIKKMPVVNYDEALAATEPYAKPVIISQSFFDAMDRTVRTWEFEMWAHHTYG